MKIEKLVIYSDNIIDGLDSEVCPSYIQLKEYDGTTFSLFCRSDRVEYHSPNGKIGVLKDRKKNNVTTPGTRLN